MNQVATTVRSTRRKRDATLSEACLQLAAYTDEACPSIPLRDVGVHIWVVGGLPFSRRLVRGPEFRLRQRRHSGIVFKKGIGLIGRAWRQRRSQIEDLDSRFSGVRNETDYATLSEDENFGLSWRAFLRVRRYRSIWAEPLFQHSKLGSEVVGVVSIDIQTSGAYQELQAATTGNPGDELEAILKACETELSR